MSELKVSRVIQSQQVFRSFTQANFIPVYSPRKTQIHERQFFPEFLHLVYGCLQGIMHPFGEIGGVAF